MKNSAKKTAYFASLLLLSTLLMACNSQASTKKQNTNNPAQNQSLTQSQATLSQAEKDGILLMREEEKLAYDVYRTLYERWQLPIFDNISASEQQHMQRMGQLISSYQLQDPIKTMQAGVFTNQELQSLYDNLVVQGNKSVVDALKVGVLIEDLDIADLMKLSVVTDQADINMVYDNLTKGSRNHLRSFTDALAQNGASYEPQHISQELFEQIINSPKERGGIGVGGAKHQQ